MVITHNAGFCVERGNGNRRFPLKSQNRTGRDVKIGKLEFWALLPAVNGFGLCLRKKFRGGGYFKRTVVLVIHLVSAWEVLWKGGDLRIKYFKTG